MGNFKIYRAFDEFLKDPNISLKAKGFLTMVFTNNITTGFEVENYCSDSKEDIKDALLKLRIAKYIRYNSETNTSHRVVPIPEALYEELTEFKRQFKKYKTYRETWFVFGDRNPIGTHKMNNWKNAYCKKAGIKQIRLHDFRHSCVSALINAKSPVPTISALVGHSTPTETLDTYSHMFEESLDGITDYFDKIYEENKQKNHQNNGD